MTFITKDGRVVETQPWGVSKVMSLVWGFVDFIIAFFQTLIPGFSSGKKDSSNFRQSGGGGWSGGGGGGGGGGGWGGGGGGGGPRGPPKPPREETSTEWGIFEGLLNLPVWQLLRLTADRYDSTVKQFYTYLCDI